MVTLEFEPDRLILEVRGSHKFWALTSRLEIPLDHIEGVHADPDPAMGWFQGLKLAGTDLPNFFRAGMFHQDGERVFWDVRHPEKTIVLDLRDEKLGKLIVEVEDVMGAIGQIRHAIQMHRLARDEAEQELGDFLSTSQQEHERLGD